MTRSFFFLCALLALVKASLPNAEEVLGRNVRVKSTRRRLHPIAFLHFVHQLAKNHTAKTMLNKGAKELVKYIFNMKETEFIEMMLSHKTIALKDQIETGYPTCKNVVKERALKMFSKKSKDVYLFTVEGTGENMKASLVHEKTLQTMSTLQFDCLLMAFTDISKTTVTDITVLSKEFKVKGKGKVKLFPHCNLGDFQSSHLTEPKESGAEPTFDESTGLPTVATKKEKKNLNYKLGNVQAVAPRYIYEGEGNGHQLIAILEQLRQKLLNQPIGWDDSLPMGNPIIDTDAEKKELLRRMAVH